MPKEATMHPSQIRLQEAESSGLNKHIDIYHL